ncbi:hypothetical protein QQF64_036354 [Cirrhinus molitorella]|uniref:ribonuclease H n=1 Tax=Cirrhinus molitorella TaxID=172907 RepID=A0ABR3NIC1_9TELE
MPLVREHLTQAQQAQQRHYNRAAQPREFQPGDHVLLLVPNSACKFLATWQGPYTVTEKVGPVTYRVRQPGRRQTEQLYHVNLLKKWVGNRTQLAALASSSPMVVDIDPQLSAAQKTELQHLVGQFSDVFSPRPGQTSVIQHDIQTPSGVIVRQRPYRIPEARRQAVEEELQDMLKLGVIEPSRSPWSSPIVMVPKPDGTLRFCNDFRRLNEISEFNGYPMPRVDELLDRLGRARYISTLDLTKGYWQVPLTKEAKPKTAFSTPSGHWQYRTLPFGLHGAPATFQRMMDILLRPHQAYASTLSGGRTIWCGCGGCWGNSGGLDLQPTPGSVVWLVPKHTIWGSKSDGGSSSPRKGRWSPSGTLSVLPPRRRDSQRRHRGAQQKRRRSSTSRRLSRQNRCLGPCPFLLQTDASDTGLGAVLSQVLEGEEHPVIYISRKLTPAKHRYATVEREALAVKWAVWSSVRAGAGAYWCHGPVDQCRGRVGLAGRVEQNTVTDSFAFVCVLLREMAIFTTKAVCPHLLVEGALMFLYSQLPRRKQLRACEMSSQA